MHIGFASYSFRNEIKKGTLSLNEIFRIAQYMDIYGIELHHKHFEPEQLSHIIKEAKSYELEIYALGPQGDLISPPEKRKKIVDNYIQYIKIAGEHKIPYVRAFMMGKYNIGSKRAGKAREKQFQYAKETLTPILEFAEVQKVSLSIESHWKFSSDVAFMKQILEIFPTKALGWLFDFGNYYSDEDRWNALRYLTETKRLNYIHAKMYNFNSIGFEPKLDYLRLVRELKKKDFMGIYSIEYEGKLSDVLGVAKSYELISHCMYGDAHHIHLNPNTDVLWEIAKKNN
jgi:sugar phosphate isomerase/epimerase